MQHKKTSDYTHWDIDEDISWKEFDPSRVDADILAVVKAAALVERNGADYAVYLKNVFHDDPDFQKLADEWAVEEIKHGDALGRWAEMADQHFDYQDTFRRFTEGYSIPLDATQSVRGSRAGELVARCIVETGTSSFYSALRDATTEPVLKAICHRIAGDEFRHYKLFYDYEKKGRTSERLSTWQRLKVAIGRFKESDDEELSFAYHCANNKSDVPFNHKASNQAYAARAFACYKPRHTERASNMIMKASGINPQGLVGSLARRLFWRFVQKRASQLARAEGLV